ncbi:hypothetical protein GCM10008959_33520 [Deinococcus seoulensis]|uniref:Uncharacterized protein n=1 Tax=Deinococcus seoulensis TaxID=1837379 RepID=A0ABQ2RYC4_9DEIO|nr:hypothetical protein [Deinococcus seoulensis]GGR68682.1 hypothetical protein GCM10008959_33520 [Deinococcus seoulensis]
MTRPRTPLLLASAPILLLSLLLGLLAAPAAAQTSPTPVKVSSQTCGAYTLTLRENGFGDPLDRVTISRGGVTHATVQDTMVAVDFCRDVTGDGIPEVMLAGFSGGAHCCFTHTLYSLSSPPRQLLRVFSAHSASLDVRQLDGKGPLELVGADWRFAYAYGMSFAESPALPVVYSYLPVPGGPPRYVNNSRAYGPFILGSVRAQEQPDYSGGLLAGYAARLIAAPGTARPYLNTLPQPFRAWLGSYDPDLRAALSDYGLSDWPARAGADPAATPIGIGGSFSGPGRTEYLALLARGTQGQTRLYRPVSGGIQAGPTLKQVPVKTSAAGALDGYVDTAWYPAFPVRRASGQDDAVIFDALSGSVHYRAYRVTPAALTEQTGALGVAATLLGDLSNVARQVASQYAQPQQPRTPAQMQELTRRIEAAVTRAQPWVAATTADFSLYALGNFTVSAIDMPQDTPDRATVTAPVTFGMVAADQDSEYVSGTRQTATIHLTRGPQGWQVTDWTLTPRPGDLYED